jgi:hypothetical protein
MKKIVFTLFLSVSFIFFIPFLSNAQLTYWLDESALESPRKDRIIESMDSCVNAYNMYSNYTRHVRVIYDASIPTANAGYNGRIAFGGSISERTAIHEMSHVLGIVPQATIVSRALLCLKLLLMSWIH